ncbi:hypothetical protein Gasu_05400, partial [Galdieria sulphuraria]
MREVYNGWIKGRGRGGKT